LYCTVKTDCLFEVAFHGDDQDRFFKSINPDVLDDLKGSIDVSTSQCSKKEDRDRIFQAIQKETSHVKLNRVVFDRLTAWMLNELATKYDPECHNIMFKLGSLHYHAGRYAEAEVLLEKSYHKRSALDPSSPETLDALEQYTATFFFRNQLQKALEYQTKYVSLAERHYEPQDMKIARAKNNHAAILVKSSNSLDDYRKGLRLYEEALDILQTRYSEDVKSKLGVLHCRADSFKVVDPAVLQALNINLVQWYEECLKGRRAELGDNHPDTLKTMHDLAELLDTDGCQKRAVALFAECLLGRKEKLEMDHPETIATMTSFEALSRKVGLDFLADALQGERLKYKPPLN
jgi:tetratricopeptide (TPR) repeat protein